MPDTAASRKHQIAVGDACSQKSTAQPESGTRGRVPLYNGTALHGVVEDADG
jgi:hypothetical protein